jgi:hypothetical protein
MVDFRETAVVQFGPTKIPRSVVAEHGIKPLEGGYKHILSIFNHFGVAARTALRLIWENMDGAD